MPSRLTDPQEIFEACLRAVQRGEASIDECVKRYPEFKALGALLRSALALRALGAESLSAEGRAAMERRLHAAYALRVRPPRRGTWRLLAVAASLSLVFGLIALLAFTSLSSLPDEPLYSVKRAIERLALTLNGESPQLLAAHARERLSEIELLAVKGVPVPPSLLEQAAQSLQHALEALPEGAERDALRIRGIEALQFVARLRPESSESALRLAQALLPTPSAPTQSAIAVQPSSTPSPTPTLTTTPSPTATHTLTPTLTLTPTPTVTRTPTIAPTDTPTAFTIIIPLATQLPSPTPTPTVTPIPPTRTPTPTLPPAVPPAVTPVPLPTLTPTATPLILPPVIVQPTLPPVLPTDTPKPEAEEASLNSPESAETPTPSPTPTLPPCDPNAPPPPLRFNEQGTPLPTFTPTPCATYTPTPSPTPRLELTTTPSGNLEPPVETPSTS